MHFLSELWFWQEISNQSPAEVFHLLIACNTGGEQLNCLFLAKSEECAEFSKWLWSRSPGERLRLVAETAALVTVRAEVDERLDAAADFELVRPAVRVAATAVTVVRIAAEAVEAEVVSRSPEAWKKFLFIKIKN